MKTLSSSSSYSESLALDCLFSLSGSRSAIADTVEAEVDADEAVAVTNKAEPEPDGFGAEILLQMHQVLAMPEN